MVVESYLPFVIDEAKSLRQGKKTLQLYRPGAWAPVNLDHPATFNTLAMDLELKKKILDDLDRFVRRKEYYTRVGKAWKRGYLLYGPPGTGKSSLVAAMAYYLNFDIYDLELSGIRSNEELNVTLSGLLNFIDGLWSSCDDERIIVFTMNHIEKLDLALLRPGRMDLHAPTSYCTPCGFKLLASNYLEINHHELFDQIESEIATTRVTPAEVAEQLMQSDKPEVALRDMVSFLANHKRKENEEKVHRSQLVEENGGSQEEESRECELIEE
ncbi:hypothetical protein NL676_006318 [Syzygium grande]|nr:hypothetical protein NL676_006318 [Syzygium grande]